MHVARITDHDIRFDLVLFTPSTHGGHEGLAVLFCLALTHAMHGQQRFPASWATTREVFQCRIAEYNESRNLLFLGKASPQYSQMFEQFAIDSLSEVDNARGCSQRLCFALDRIEQVRR